MIEAHTRDAQDAVSRLLAELESLKPNRAELTESEVHRTRVAIKQVRAWLKLCRAVTGKTAACQQSVASLRMLSQALSGQRDRDVALLTLARLIRKTPGKKAQHCVEVLSRWITENREPAATEYQIDISIEQLGQQLLPFVGQQIPEQTQRAVISHAYISMCKAGAVALKSEACTDLHAWRKRVKTLGYQLAMVNYQLANKQKLHIRLGKLGNRLGEIHDLCVLQGMVTEVVAQLPAVPDPAPVMKRIRRERRRLIESAQKHYVRVCSEDQLRLAEAE